MSHIDEGQLHAYLDGESGAVTDREAVERHLETCAGCRERLDTERKLRERAAAILSGSGPGAVSAPPFDDIVARSRAARVRGRYLRLNRLAALGWAAVIFLAVGVGWIARGTIGVGSPTQEIAAAPGDSARTPGFHTLTREVIPEERAAPATGEAEPAASGRGAARRERSQPTAMAKSETQNERQLLAEAELEERPEEADRLVAAAAPERQAEARLRVVDGVRADAPQDALEALDADAWRVAGSDAAEQHIGGPVHTVPLLPVLAYRLGEVGGAPTVRVVQQLPSGDPLELIQRRADAEQIGAVGGVASAMEQARHKRDSVDVEGPAEAVATVTRGVYLITGRAALPADSLVALLESIPQ